MDTDTPSTNGLSNPIKPRALRSASRSARSHRIAARGINPGRPRSAAREERSASFLRPLIGECAVRDAVRRRLPAPHQSIDLAVAAEELGVDGAYFRVHHFTRQAASPFPLLAAIGARVSKIEICTGVIDIRSSSAPAVDPRSRRWTGWRYFGYVPVKAEAGDRSSRSDANDSIR